MKTVRISRNYSEPDLFRQTPNCSAKWGDFIFTEHDTESDYLIILNKPDKDIASRFCKGGVILFSQEPPYSKNNYYTSFYKFVDAVVTKGFNSSDAIQLDLPLGLPWLIDKSYDQLIDLKPGEKNNKICWITSNSNINPGHQKRLDFLNFLKENNFKFDLYGRGFSPVKDKFPILYSCKYSINIENYSGNDYFTEKMLDSLLCFTIPFYYGCKNIDKYFPKNSFVLIDINRPDYSMSLMSDIVNSNFWQENYSAIEEARDLILNKFQLFPLIANYLSQSKISKKKKKYFIPSDGLTKIERLRKRVDLFFKK